MISSRQIKAARALLGWKGQDLADKSGVGITTLRRYEAQDGMPNANKFVRPLQSLTVATIERRVASLSSIFNLTKSTNPTKEPVVILTFKKTSKKIWKTSKTSNTSNL